MENGLLSGTVEVNVVMDDATIIKLVAAVLVILVFSFLLAKIK